MMEMVFHADDFGASAQVSGEIISCILEGDVRSVSFMPNMSCFAESASMLSQVADRVKVSVHFNIMEGFSVSGPKQIPLLADRDGLFSVSFGKLLFYAVLKRKELTRQVKAEFKAQADRVRAVMPRGYKLRIDSHQHPHMIPAVFKALLEAVQEEGWDTEYIRVAAEPVWPFLKKRELWKTYSAVNIIKNLLLNVFALRDIRLLKQYPEIQYYDFMGVWFSGCMDRNRVAAILPEMIKRGRRPLEVLFHPGRMLRKELGLEFNKEGFNEFHLSKNRMVEEAAVKSGLLALFFK